MYKNPPNLVQNPVHNPVLDFDTLIFHDNKNLLDYNPNKNPLDY